MVKQILNLLKNTVTIFILMLHIVVQDFNFAKIVYVCFYVKM